MKTIGDILQSLTPAVHRLSDRYGILAMSALSLTLLIALMICRNRNSCPKQAPIPVRVVDSFWDHVKKVALAVVTAALVLIATRWLSTDGHADDIIRLLKAFFAWLFSAGDKRLG